MKKKLAKILCGVLAASMMLTGCGIDKKATLIDINSGKDAITLGYGYFQARFMQAEYDGMYRTYYGDSYWSQDMSGSGSTMEDQVKEQLVTMLEEQYLLRQHASDYDVKISDKEQKKINKAAKKFMKDNSEDAIKQLGATEEYVKQMMEDQYYVYYVEEAIKKAANIEVTDEEAKQKTFSYVKFSLTTTDQTTGQSSAVSDEEKETLKSNAQNLATSNDFDGTAEALGASVATQSYGADDVGSDTFTAMDQSILTAAEGLAEGQISDVIEVADDGYYVIRMDSLDDKDAAATKKESLKTQKETEAYNKVMDGWKDETKFKLDKKQWKKVKFDTLFEAASTTTD